MSIVVERPVEDKADKKVPEVAQRWRVNCDKVLRLIKSGQLRAKNLALDPNGRPRWRISQEAIAEFEQSRSSRPPAPKPRRRRRVAEVATGPSYY